MLIIFCEGVTDQIFIADCIEKYFDIIFERKKNRKSDKKIDIGFENKIEIIEIGGCEKLSADIHVDRMKDNLSNEGANIVIFDADYTEKKNGNKGFKSCKEKLDNLKKREALNFSYFLWPNNENDGDVEDLLEKLIPKSKVKLYECIESHQTCIDNLEIDGLRKNGVKEKVNFYLHTCNLNPQPSKRDYKNTDFWNLDYSEINELRVFIDFLTPIVSNHLESPISS